MMPLENRLSAHFTIKVQMMLKKQQQQQSCKFYVSFVLVQ